MSDPIVSEDGFYEWDGSAWVPRPQHLWPAAAVDPEPAEEPEEWVPDWDVPVRREPEPEHRSGRRFVLPAFAAPRRIVPVASVLAVLGLAVGYFALAPGDAPAPEPSAAPEPSSVPEEPITDGYSVTGTPPATAFDLGERLFFNDDWAVGKSSDGTFTIEGLTYTDARTGPAKKDVDLEFTVHNGTAHLAEGTCKIAAGGAKKTTAATDCSSSDGFVKDFDYVSFAVAW